MVDMEAIQLNLQQLLQLPENWDSYGARPISSVAAEKALAILERAQHWGDLTQDTPFIAPLASGGIQMEWGSPNGQKELLIEVPYSGDKVRYLLVEVDKSGQEHEREAVVYGLTELDTIMTKLKEKAA